MRILFSVYIEDCETGKVDFKESIWVRTDWTVQEIENHVALLTGFRSDIAIGEHLSFFDYYCFFADYSALIKRIKAIPKGADTETPKHTPNVFRVIDFDPGDVVVPEYPVGKRCYLYNLERYECGASSYEALVYWASSHPFEMMFIGGLIFDFSKWLLLKLLTLFGFRKNPTAMRPLILNAKKLYRNFSKITKIKIKDCQITKLNSVKANTFHVLLRTSTNRSFKLKCHANGSIESIEELSKTKPNHS